jgi:hypothetical protein
MKQPAGTGHVDKIAGNASQIPSQGRASRDPAGRQFERAVLVHHREGARFGPERDLAQAYNASPKAVRRRCAFWNRAFWARCGVHGGLALRVPAVADRPN